MLKKYIVELDIPDEAMEVLERTALDLETVLLERLRSAFGPVTRGRGIKMYPYGSSPAAIDLFDNCPVCNHTWGAHFSFVDGEGKRLKDPTPTECSQCKATHPDNPCYPNSIIQEKME